MIEDEITRRVLKAAFKVHSGLGPGLLESSYKACLAYELINDDLHVEVEKPMLLVYEEVKLEVVYRIDLLIEKCVVVEINEWKHL